MIRSAFGCAVMLFGTVAAYGEPNLQYAPLPVAVSSFGAAVSGGYVYLYGGHAGKAHDYSTETVVNTFHRLKLSDPVKWEELPAGPGLQGLAMVAHKGMIYRIGGMQPRNKPGEPDDTLSVALCERYDPRMGRWEKFPELPESRSSHDAVVLGDTIYVVGGWKMNGKGTKPEWTSTMLKIDLSKNEPKWEAIKVPYVQRRALTAAASGGKVYAIGGLTQSGKLSRRVDVYDPKDNAWTNGPDIPGPEMNGFSPAAAIAGGELYLSVNDGEVYRLSKKQDAWTAVAALQQPRFVHRLVAGGDDLLLALGGASKKGNVAATEAVIPSRSKVKAAPPEKK